MKVQIKITYRNRKYLSIPQEIENLDNFRKNVIRVFSREDMFELESRDMIHFFSKEIIRRSVISILVINNN